jgi:hypothetical protein
MAYSRPNPGGPVATRSELPPGIDAPPPPKDNGRTAGERDRSPGGRAGDESGSTLELIHEVKQLADRAVGLDNLRALVDELAGLAR